MVAPASSFDTEKAVDPGQTVQGHVSQRVKQVFTLRRERLVENRKLKIRATEFIYGDQLGNVYVTYRSTLPDGEVYDVTDWVAIEKGATLRLVKDFKKFQAFNDDMIDYLREKAFVAFGREVSVIMKARHNQAATATTMTTGEELTKCAHLLADQIISSAKAAPKSDNAPTGQSSSKIATSGGLTMEKLLQAKALLDKGQVKGTYKLTPPEELKEFDAILDGSAPSIITSPIQHEPKPNAEIILP